VLGVNANELVDHRPSLGGVRLDPGVGGDRDSLPQQRGQVFVGLGAELAHLRDGPGLHSSRPPQASAEVGVLDKVS
jgi:hypothetical protein